MQTGKDHIILLRSALFNEDGTDKNVLLPFAAMCMFDRGGLDASITLETRTEMSKVTRQWAFDLTKENVAEAYDDSGYGWDDDDKVRVGLVRR